MASLHLPRWMTIAYVLAISITTTVAQTVTAADDGDLPRRIRYPEHDHMMLGGPKFTDYGWQIIALTTDAETTPEGALQGRLYNATSDVAVSTDDVALLSCDADSYPGPSGPMDYLETVGGAGAEHDERPSVLFYSEKEQWCNLEDYDGPVARVYSIFSMTGSRRARTLLSHFRDEPEMQVRIGTLKQLEEIRGEEENDDAGTFASSAIHSHGERDDNESPGHSPSTAVAMIILYSITGIITTLFVVIVLTGAIRAHRHPERYGPRHVFGRPRQSRARGLARAMLDSLPIVKVGEREQNKESDLELAERNNSEAVSEEHGAKNSPTTNATEVNADGTAEPSVSPPGNDGTNNATGAPSGIAAARAIDRPAAESDKLGCSICTDNFETGQDQRVLPCDHRFHPECVDPWLLNVSGTCPLCRIDLRPADARQEPQLDDHGNPIEGTASASDGNMPPPLGQVDGQPPPRMGIRRSLVVGLMGNNRVEFSSREERLAALRQHRAAQLGRNQAAEGSASEAGNGQIEEGRIRGRLRRVLNIRTRRTGAAANEGEVAAEGSTAEGGESNEAAAAPSADQARNDDSTVR
ncbi:hypothetical protein MBLNU230_g3440t1 [Neophaeotheca triangularis]